MYFKMFKTNFKVYYHRSWSIINPVEYGHVLHIAWFLFIWQSLPVEGTASSSQVRNEFVKAA